MAKREMLTYGLGGYDPNKPDSNVVRREMVEVDDPFGEFEKVSSQGTDQMRTLLSKPNLTTQELAQSVRLLMQEHVGEVDVVKVTPAATLTDILKASAGLA